MRIKIVLATHNQDKCAEILEILRGMPINLLTLNEFPEIGEIIEDGETLEENHRLEARCGGLNQSPQLNWSGVPEDAASLVIILSDADADNFTHWAMYNIPKATSSLARNAAAPAGATELDNYAGPCPPVNDGINHRYVFKIYALNAPIDAPPDDPGDIAALKASMKGKIIACGQIIGKYERTS